MTSTTTITDPPFLEDTYNSEDTLHLYSYPLPTPPDDKECRYKDEPPFTQRIDLYNKSIEERIPVPSSSPDLTIVLKKRLSSSRHNIPHAWLAQVQTSAQTSYPSELVAKIYDPVWFDDAPWYNPFELRNRSVAQEVECYRRFEPIQGTKVPQFYGHFITPLPSQHDRTVNVILMQCVPGDDLRHIAPPDVAGAVCAAHKNAVIKASLNLGMDLIAFGVKHLDFHPRNIILLPPKSKDREFCAFSTCPLRLRVDCEEMDVFIIDFESVEFTEPKHYSDIEKREVIDNSREMYLEHWLEGLMG